jgi:malonyl-CoA/methylmalonyl-CoA synthetase
MPEEVVDFYHRFNAKCIITHTAATELATGIQYFTQTVALPAPNLVPVHACAASDATDTQQVSIDPSITLPSNRPVIALFSSGTAGPPKGIIHALRYFTANIGPLGPEEALVLAHRAMHFGASLTSVITTILRGIRLDILRPDSSPEQVWERLRQGGVTNLAGSAGFWVSLMEHFQQRLAGLPSQELQPYLDGARGLRVANCSGVMAMPSTKLFWKEIRGRPLQMVWGSTESSIGLKTSSDVDTTYLVRRGLWLLHIHFLTDLECNRAAHSRSYSQALRGRSWRDESQDAYNVPSVSYRGHKAVPS